MFGAKVNFVDGLRGWMDRLPIRLRRSEKELSVAAGEVTPIAETEGQEAVIGAMGWGGAKWNGEVAKVLKDI